MLQKQFGAVKVEVCVKAACAVPHVLHVHYLAHVWHVWHDRGYRGSTFWPFSFLAKISTIVCVFNAIWMQSYVPPPKRGG